MMIYLLSVYGFVLYEEFPSTHTIAASDDISVHLVLVKAFGKSKASAVQYPRDSVRPELPTKPKVYVIR